MSSGNQCRAALRIILPTAKPMVTNLSIRRFMGLRDRLSFRFGPRKCTKSLNTGLQLTGPIRRASKARSIAKNLQSEWTGSKNWWNCRQSLAMLKNLWIRSKKTIWPRKSMSLRLMALYVLYPRIQGQSTLPTRFIPRSGKGQQVPRSMDAWFHWRPSLRQVTRLRSLPVLILLVPVGTGLAWLRPVRPAIKFVNSLKTKTRNYPSLKVGNFCRLNSRKMAM